MNDSPRGMTADEIRALPASTPFKLANKALNISDSAGYTLRRQGGYPVPVLEIGRCLRVRRTDILDYLGIDEHEEAESAAGCATTTTAPDENAVPSSTDHMQNSGAGCHPDARRRERTCPRDNQR